MNLVERAKNILITPKTEWEVIKKEDLTINQMFIQYAIILAAIPAIATFIGVCFIGVTVPFLDITYRVPIGTGLGNMVVTYLFSLGGVYIVALIMDALAPSFGSTKNIVSSFKVTVFSYTAVWLAGIFSIIPVLSILSIVGLYSFYLLYLGMGSIKEVPKDKLVGYLVVLIITMIVIFVVLGLIVQVIFPTSYLGLR